MSIDPNCLNLINRATDTYVGSCYREAGFYRLWADGHRIHVTADCEDDLLAFLATIGLDVIDDAAWNARQDAREGMAAAILAS